MPWYQRAPSDTTEWRPYTRGPRFRRGTIDCSGKHYVKSGTTIQFQDMRTISGYIKTWQVVCMTWISMYWWCRPRSWKLIDFKGWKHRNLDNERHMAHQLLSWGGDIDSEVHELAWTQNMWATKVWNAWSARAWNTRNSGAWNSGSAIVGKGMIH